MRLFPAQFGARKREDDSAPVVEPDGESQASVFNLIPPRAANKYERPDKVETTASASHAEASELRAVNATDLARMSIDNDGRLYWDGKPVELQRRISMSPAQMTGAIVVAVFVIIGALGSVLSATASVHEWSCRIGLTETCTAPATAPESKPPARIDIPA